MIPDFKTYINESVWGDLRKRSSGEVIRREDNVDFLSQDELFDYINDHYVTDKFVIDNDHKPIDKTNSIHVPFAIPEEYSYGYGFTLEFKKKEKVITFSSDLKNELPDVYNKLCENYNVEAITRFLSTISPLDGSEITNKFYIELIDFVIKNVDEEHKIIKIK